MSHENDDAEENEKGKVDRSSSDLEMVNDGGTQLVGIRFNEIKLSPQDDIRNAYIQFTCDEISSSPTSLIITAEDSGNAKRFSDDSHDLSSRSTTKSEIGWEPEPWLVPGASAKIHRTPDLTPIIKSVISRPDWKPGNSLAFLISGSGKRSASAWSSKAGEKAAKLVVDVEESDDAATKREPIAYRIRLFFGVPKPEDRGDQVVDVYAQGKRVLKKLKLDSNRRGAKFAIAEVPNVKIDDELHLRFVPRQGNPILSGLEMERQPSAQSE